MLSVLSKIATEASHLIMEIYQGDNFNIETKEDNSPVTVADLKANDYICKSLKEHFDYPILSEEAVVDYRVRKHWKKFWMVDPLDGTRSFISKQDDFTVNIALIEGNRPVAGVLALPVTGEVFTAEKDKGCFKNGEKVSNNSTRKALIASASRVHTSRSTQAFIKKNSISEIISRGSSLKFALLAEGLIDVYPRLGPTSEWDIAAGHIICEEAGCEVYNAETREKVQYNKKNLLNPHFIACRKGLTFKN